MEEGLDGWMCVGEMTKEADTRAGLTIPSLQHVIFFPFFTPFQQNDLSSFLLPFFTFLLIYLHASCFIPVAMVFNPDIQPEILPPPFPTSDPILHPSLHKILDPSLSLHHKDPQSATCFKKKSRKRFKSRPEILHISEYKGKETLGVNVMGIVAAAPKKAFQCAGGHRGVVL